MKKFYFSFFLIKALFSSSKLGNDNSLNDRFESDSSLESKYNLSLNPNKIAILVDESVVNPKVEIPSKPKKESEFRLLDNFLEYMMTNRDFGLEEISEFESKNNNLSNSIIRSFIDLINEKYLFLEFNKKIQSLELQIYNLFIKEFQKDLEILLKKIEKYNIKNKLLKAGDRNNSLDYKIKLKNGFLQEFAEKFNKYYNCAISIFKIYYEKSKNKREYEDFQNMLLVLYRIYKVKYFFIEILNKNIQYKDNNKKPCDEISKSKSQLGTIKNIFSDLQNYEDNINEVKSFEFFEYIFTIFEVKIAEIGQIETASHIRIKHNNSLKYLENGTKEKTEKEMFFRKYNFDFATDLKAFFKNPTVFLIQLKNKDEKSTQIKNTIINLIEFFDAINVHYNGKEESNVSLSELKAKLDHIRKFIVEFDLMYNDLIGLCFNDTNNFNDCNKNIDLRLNAHVFFILYNMNRLIEKLYIEILKLSKESKSEKKTLENASVSLFKLCKSIQNNFYLLLNIIDNDEDDISY